MQVGIVLYGAARVVIGQSQISLEFDSLSVTLGEVLGKLITLYPRARPYLLDESGTLPPYMRILINEVRPNPDATLSTRLHDLDRVTLLVAVAGGTSSAGIIEERSAIDSIYCQTSGKPAFRG